jgi:uncharacterized RDD family membrane protein YckC
MAPLNQYGIESAALFGLRVVSHSGAPLGSITAVIHRAAGCDVLVERRHWWHRTVLRLDLDDLAPLAIGVLQHHPRVVGARPSASGPGDDAVA